MQLQLKSSIELGNCRSLSAYSARLRLFHLLLILFTALACSSHSSYSPYSSSSLCTIANIVMANAFSDLLPQFVALM